ncbi:ABC transporter ATP-binding protein [Marinitenerispora sediminis]|uniref:Spermidine/putrescine import ATP-binding protein PotA n=1 Tax=Marinitenerispora sediminis TaxID=1931232 RepID=A0A368T1L3_9ACTN|nr:ABC transporter ATP-binding protein [Marinitenerispora sediminis]RCV50938.1 spermidine/putrescine ABC transporter ATP-binding protein [Marinitenerispora sediminis]RCV51612.1 spermidine/putrescine ABC transporter ATP-binding protein [Marinitenerispora sediminis]RCV54271.1 spermidine/putrescine ABC transporter ATP-binding protein [Marinitenerispora sediminis]
MATTTDPAAGARTAGTASDGDGPAIELEGVAKTYRAGRSTVTAVRHLDLAVAPGEYFAVVGPSGCGKTTTLRMIGGFEEPTAGTVRLAGRDVTGVPPDRRDVNTVFQSYALFPHMSVADNVAFGLRRRRVPAAEVRRRVGDMLDLVELTGVASRRPGRLSGGQQQRVALARALVNRPGALLLDEPLGALDPLLRQAMRAELKRLQREVGATFVHVTHDQGEALAMADRLAVMAGGRVRQTGAPAEVYERPADRFVAGFVGAANLLTGTVRTSAGGDGYAAVDLDGGQRVRAATAAGPGARIDLTVRPEKIRIAAAGTEGPDGGANLLRGTVRDAVYQGPATHYTVLVAGAGAAEPVELVVHRQNSAAAGPALRVGAEVRLTWPPEHSHVLGPA